MPDSPEQRYRRALLDAEMRADAGQARAVRHLQRLWEELGAAPAAPKGLRARLGLGRRPRPTAPRGVYLWGGVGRGKTWLMDLFFDALPGTAQRRTHFYAFMRDVHERLRALGEERDPLLRVAADLTREARVLCLDEMQVTDITDAMLMGRLLEAVFAQGGVLVTTSNIAPHDLYRDGLQRARFLPAIDLLEARCEVVELTGDVDHRLRTLEQAEIYHAPLDVGAEVCLERAFAALSGGQDVQAGELEINGRGISYRACNEEVAWFDFDTLCAEPRAKEDYMELARRFHTLIVARVPIMDDMRNDAARRWIQLVDVLYDCGVKLIVSAAALPDGLYTGRRLAFEFERTVSRLQEMQSRAYLAQGHRWTSGAAA
jgi:cell division protein ZapE